MDREKKYHIKINAALTPNLLTMLRSVSRSPRDLVSAIRASSFRRWFLRRRRWRFWFEVSPVSSSYWSSSELIKSSSKLSAADDGSDASVSSSAVNGSCSSRLWFPPSACDQRLSSLRSVETGCEARPVPASMELRRRWWLPAESPILKTGTVTWEWEECRRELIPP